MQAIVESISSRHGVHWLPASAIERQSRISGRLAPPPTRAQALAAALDTWSHPDSPPSAEMAKSPNSDDRQIGE
jgi:hypothetical protein